MVHYNNTSHSPMNINPPSRICYPFIQILLQSRSGWRIPEGAVHQGEGRQECASQRGPSGKMQILNLKQKSIFNEHLKQKTKVAILLPNLELDRQLETFHLLT